MIERLTQSVTSVLNENAKTVSLGTGGISLATILKYIPPTLGCIGILAGVVSTLYIIRRNRKETALFEAERSLVEKRERLIDLEIKGQEEHNGGH